MKNLIMIAVLTAPACEGQMQTFPVADFRGSVNADCGVTRHNVNNVRDGWMRSSASGSVR